MSHENNDWLNVATTNEPKEVSLYWTDFESNDIHGDIQQAVGHNEAKWRQVKDSHVICVLIDRCSKIFCFYSLSLQLEAAWALINMSIRNLRTDSSLLYSLVAGNA